MQVAPVFRTNILIAELDRVRLRPSDLLAVPQEQTFAPSSVGPLYNEHGLISGDRTPEGVYKPFYDIA